MERQVVRLTEEQLHNIISESVQMILSENEQEEGWFGDKWNQVKSAYQTATQDNGVDFKKRMQNVKKNWNTQGQVNNLSNLINQLTQLVQQNKIDPQITVGQLVGGKYNQGKVGKLTLMRGNRKGQISRRGGKSY